jgi:hypothetical protein
MLRQHAFDPIPRKAISLVGAFEGVCGEFPAHPDLIKWLQEVRRDWWQSIEKNKEDVGAQANAFFRAHLTLGKRKAHVRDPEAGETRDLDPNGWMPEEAALPAITNRIDSNYVISPSDQVNPGPEQHGRNVRRWKHAFDRAGVAWFLGVTGSIPVAPTTI